MKIKSHPKPVVDFESNSESVKSNKRFYSKKYQNENYTNNQQKCIHCLKPRSNKNEREFYTHAFTLFAIAFMCPIIKVFHP